MSATQPPSTALRGKMRENGLGPSRTRMFADAVCIIHTERPVQERRYPQPGPHVADGSSNLLLHRQHRQGTHRPRLPRSGRQDFPYEAIAKADVAVENFRPGVVTTTGVLESEGGRPTRVGISVSPTPRPASTTTSATTACRPSSPPHAWPARSGSSANGLHEKNWRETKACMKSVLTTDTAENCQKKSTRPVGEPGAQHRRRCRRP